MHTTLNPKPAEHLLGVSTSGYLVGVLIIRGSYSLGSMLGAPHFRKPPPGFRVRFVLGWKLGYTPGLKPSTHNRRLKTKLCTEPKEPLK